MFKNIFREIDKETFSLAVPTLPDLIKEGWK
jgi:hypothetical protein